MLDAISKPIALSQLIEHEVRGTSVHPISFGELDNITITEANLQLLQSHRIIRERINAYFENEKLAKLWDDIKDATYYFVGLSLVNEPADRARMLKGQILPILKDINNSKVIEYMDELSNNRSNKTRSEYTSSLEAIKNWIFELQDDLSRHIMNEKIKQT